MGTLTDYFHRVMNGPAFRPGEEMKYEAIRLSSYKQWPHWALVQPTLLARAGFYYTGTGDEVICFSCRGKIKEWAKGDDPASEHRRWFPDCAVVAGTDRENVPLEPAPEHRDRFARSTTNNGGEASTRQAGAPQTSSAAEGTDAEMATSMESAYRYRFEEERLGSFAAWPKPFIRPEDLAKAGFFYLGDADRAQCAFCRGVLRNWDAGDDPATEHRKHFPDCPLISGRGVGNVAVVVASSVTRQATAKNGVSLRKDRQVGSALLGVNTERAKHPNMAKMEERMLSYTSWPSSSRQDPRVLAEAGFFYAGYSDNVKCFYCDGGLRNWEPSDEAWMEHARWFPRCSFLRQFKGEQYVNDIQTRYGNPNSSGTNAVVPGQGQVEINRGNGQYKNSNILTVSQAPPSANRGIEYRVDPREVKARMDTATVRAVLSMGFSRDVVRQVIDTRLRAHGDDFPNAESLLEAIWGMEGEGELPVTTPVPTTSANPETSMPEEPNQSVTSESKKAKRRRNKKKNKKKNKSSSTDTKETKEEEEKKFDEKKDDEEKDDEEDDSEEEEGPRGAEGATFVNEEDTKSLIEENRELKEARTCKVCMDEDVNVVFLPCGHLVCCGNCAPALRKCPICRGVIRGTVKIFLS